MSALRMEAEAMKILKATVREPIAVHLSIAGASTNHLRVSIRQHMRGEAKRAIAALFGGIMRIKHVWVFDEDVDVHNNAQCEWAFGTRFQADEDAIVLPNMSGMTMDPSLHGRRLGSKAGFDCTRPFGVNGQIPFTRCAAKTSWSGIARFQTVEQALESGPHFYAALVEAVGSQDGREVACALDDLRQKGKLGRDRDGRYHLAAAEKGMTGIVGELYHDPNEGA
jgi:3-polyprenyl-4-hydroxybenzoate decarboxylase